MRNLIRTAYLTLNHNSIVVAYVTGFVICALLSLWRPSRYILLTLLGFLTLSVGFEYDKHLVGPLVRQTVDSVVGSGDYVRTTKFINILLGEFVPVVFFVVGWILIFAAIINGARGCRKNRL